MDFWFVWNQNKPKTMESFPSLLFIIPYLYICVWHPRSPSFKGRAGARGGAAAADEGAGGEAGRRQEGQTHRRARQEVSAGWSIWSDSRFGWVRCGRFPRQVGHFCGYLLPMQDGGTSQISANSTQLCIWADEPSCSTRLVQVRAKQIWLFEAHVKPICLSCKFISSVHSTWLTFLLNPAGRKSQ